SGLTGAPKVASAPRGPGTCRFARYRAQSLPQAPSNRIPLEFHDSNPFPTLPYNLRRFFHLNTKIRILTSF
ncbi:MAG: hypothetical protein O3C32_07690, partial [Bacteroidetes bacterium]|nr:hypothetical protein [Bacteroidota bacterium]